MPNDRVLQGAFEDLEIAGEAVAVQGSVRRARVLAKGYLTVQGLCILQGAIVGIVHMTAAWCCSRMRRRPTSS